MLSLLQEPLNETESATHDKKPKRCSSAIGHRAFAHSCSHCRLGKGIVVTGKHFLVR